MQLQYEDLYILFCIAFLWHKSGGLAFSKNKLFPPLFGDTEGIVSMFIGM